jgi:hypothetical protein
VSDTEEWHQEVSHLVQAHGADPGRLLGYVFPLGEIRWVHFDTHAALAVVGLRPPDGHMHPASADLWPPMTVPHGYETALPVRDRSLSRPAASPYRPFESSPEVRAGAFESARERGEHDIAFPEDTGLPQTELRPRTEADLRDWASGSMRVLGEICDEYPDTLDRAATFQLKRDRITELAEAAAARWMAMASFPGGQSPPSTWPLGRSRRRQRPPTLRQARGTGHRA